MDRNSFKLMALGQFISTHRGESIDNKIMSEFVDGALFSYDLLMKKIKAEEKIEAFKNSEAIDDTHDRHN